MVSEGMYEDVIPEEKYPGIHHYTNIGNLIGILESGTLWASRYDFLNDENEVKYGVNILKETCPSLEGFHWEA